MSLVVEQVAVGNGIPLDSDMEHLLVGRVVVEAQREVCDRVKDMGNVKARDATAGKSKEVCYINFPFLSTQFMTNSFLNFT